MQIFRHTLSNGIRLVHHRTNGMVAHCGLIMETGSRNETDAEHGMAHFIEHMLFKGTKKHNTYYILTRLDEAGGELNAYTTKEETAIHASILKEDFEKALAMISDISFNSVYPENEIQKEKDVIIDEINSYLDNPAELIFDDFEELAFPGQALGRNILGTPQTVKSFTRDDIDRFTAKNYSTHQMVLCSVGNIPDEQVLRLFIRYFDAVPEKIRKTRKSSVSRYTPSSLTRHKKTYQNHCIIGNVAFPVKDKRRPAMFLLNNLLGGQGMNSRLNLSLREKRGLAYNVESSYNAYNDTGIFSIYFGTDAQNLEKSISITHSELNKLRTTQLGTVQLSKARNQVKGYLARGFEHHESLMLSMGKSLLVADRIDTLEELCRKIDNVSASEILEISNEVFEPSRLSMLIYK
ncbi:MAG TPA: pitrilysin family protein [Bacteroidales bacterium]|nr:pitrilysin family protein [Bacteroidales bacterium]